jgi:indole-3-glycerol phosphate synthase
VIAEVKFASPSEGFLRKSDSASAPEAARIAASYHKAGAAAISILTEPEYFSGDPDFLKAARAACPEAVLLMKDFVVDHYQLTLARACGADAVLLIAALLGPRLHELLFSARALGLSTLVEVHDEAEAEAALGFTADVLGVNNRDLRTLKTDLDVSRRLAPLARKAAAAVAESGLHTRREIDELYGLGYKGFLIGSSFMKTPDAGAALAGLLGAS